MRAKLKRNPNYHRDVWVDEVEHVAVIDPVARTSALIGGDVHFMDRCELKTIEQLKQNTDIQVDALTGYGHYNFAMNVTQPPFDKLEVRQALKWAVDRDEIVKKILYGYGIAGNDNPIAPSIKFATNPEPVYKYDPEKAKALLKKAGGGRTSRWIFRSPTRRSRAPSTLLHQGARPQRRRGQLGMRWPEARLALVVRLRLLAALALSPE